MGNKKVFIGGVAGILSSVALMLVCDAILGDTWRKDMYWEEWLMLIAMYAVPIIIGIWQGSWDEDLWRVLLLPLLGGIAATIITFIIAIIVQLFRSGDIWIAIVGTLLFMALTAPVSKVFLIFFE